MAKQEESYTLQQFEEQFRRTQRRYDRIERWVVYPLFRALMILGVFATVVGAHNVGLF